MEIGDRIKQRREALMMSQEELARKVGYKSRSSINKIEIDGRGLPQKKIIAFANALETTPAYLMGWENNNELSSFPDKNITFNDQSNSKPSKSSEPLIDITKFLVDHYGPAAEGMIMFSELDLEDRAEIKGEMRQMLKADKYKTKDIYKNA